MFASHAQAVSIDQILDKAVNRKILNSSGIASRGYSENNEKWVYDSGPRYG
jgi:hypothetical protein